MGFRAALSRNIMRFNLAVADSWVGAWFKLDDGRSIDRRTGAIFTVRFRLVSTLAHAERQMGTAPLPSIFFFYRTDRTSCRDDNVCGHGVHHLRQRIYHLCYWWHLRMWRHAR